VKKNVLKMFAGDMMYSVLALCTLNGILQLFVNPYLTRQMGATDFGVILSIQSVVSIMASTFGTGANYSRMMTVTKKQDPKGDYNIFLVGIGLLSLAVTLVMLYVFDRTYPDRGIFSAGMYVSSLVLMVATVLRYYGDVSYKQTVNYRGYLVYYIVISAGYIVGTLLYPVTHSWGLALCLGEVCATVFVAATGVIYKRPLFEKSEKHRYVMQSVWQLSFAYLISGMIMNADRILLMLFVGSAEVTVFYTATLVGKIVAMLTSPLNGVVMGHLSQYEGKLTRKAMGLISALMLLVCVVVLACSVVVSHVFVKIMYPDVYELARPLFLIANAGQIFYFTSESLMVIVLRFTGEKLQIVLNVAYAVLFFALVVPAVLLYGLNGLAAGILIANVIRYAAVTVVGIMFGTK
jgi:O-antigen/teichoic acid export membrane protein